MFLFQVVFDSSIDNENIYFRYFVHMKLHIIVGDIENKIIYIDSNIILSFQRFIIELANSHPILKKVQTSHK